MALIKQTKEVYIIRCSIKADTTGAAKFELSSYNICIYVYFALININATKVSNLLSGRKSGIFPPEKWRANTLCLCSPVDLFLLMFSWQLTNTGHHSGHCLRIGSARYNAKLRTRRNCTNLLQQCLCHCFSVSLAKSNEKLRPKHTLVFAARFQHEKCACPYYTNKHK